MQGKRFSIGLTATLAVLTVALFATSTSVATEKKLHNFGVNGADGKTPLAGLVFDAAGNLYGTTDNGGSDGWPYDCHGFGCGTVFEESPKEGGGWTERVLHYFGMGADEAYPNGDLIMDAAGNLYGTTSNGGSYPGYGTVFEIVHQ